MNFAILTNQKFTERFKAIVKEERRITAEVLLYFREAEKRMLFAEYAYPSLLAFAVGELRYSESAACRRISAMRVMRDIPEVKEKIQTGELSLSTVTQASTFIRQSEKQSQEKFTIEEKRDVLKAIEGQSIQKTEKILLSLNPDLKPLTEEKQRAQADGSVQVTTTLDAELMGQLEEIQVLLGKKMQIKDLLKFLAQEKLKSLRQKSQRPAPPTAAVKPITVSNQETVPEPVRTRPAISVHIKRTLLNQSGYRCCFVDPVSNRRCEEKHHLQIDHIMPKAFGGSDDVTNLEVLCGSHNKLRALQKLGVETMADFMPSLR